VTQVESGAGERAGLQRGDVIRLLNGETVADVSSFDDIVDDIPVGENVPLQIIRRRNPMFLAIKITDKR